MRERVHTAGSGRTRHGHVHAARPYTCLHSRRSSGHTLGRPHYTTVHAPYLMPLAIATRYG